MIFPTQAHPAPLGLKPTVSPLLANRPELRYIPAPPVVAEEASTEIVYICHWPTPFAKMLLVLEPKSHQPPEREPPG